MANGNTQKISRAFATRRLSEPVDRGQAVIRDAPWGVRLALAGEVPMGVADVAGLADDYVRILEDGCVCPVVHDLDPAETIDHGDLLGFTGVGYAPSGIRGLPALAVAELAADEADGEPLILVKLHQTPAAGSPTYADPGGIAEDMVFFGGAATPGVIITVDGLDYPEVDAPAADGEWTNGASATESAANFTAAVAADARPHVWLAFVGGNVETSWLYWPSGAAGNVAVTVTAGNVSTGGTSFGGRDAGGQSIMARHRVINAHLIQAGTIELVTTGFVAEDWLTEARRVTGGIAPYDLLITVETSPDRLTVEVSNPGQVNLDDRIQIVVFGNNI